MKELDSSVSIVPRLDNPRIVVWFLAGSRGFYSTEGPDRHWTSTNLLFKFHWWLFNLVQSGRGLRLTTHLRLVSRLKVSGAVLHFLSTPSWHTEGRMYLHLFWAHSQNWRKANVSIVKSVRLSACPRLPLIGFAWCCFRQRREYLGQTDTSASWLDSRRPQWGHSCRFLPSVQRGRQGSQRTGGESVVLNGGTHTCHIPLSFPIKTVRFSNSIAK